MKRLVFGLLVVVVVALLGLIGAMALGGTQPSGLDGFDSSTLAIAAVVWAVCGIVAAFLAPTKGRSAGQWFVIGLILGLFGLAMLALAPALPAKPAERQ